MNSGIYFICNLITNQIYIGSASNLRSRENHHFGSLRRNKHYNKKLQNSFNKYGSNDFEFQILEFCEKKDLIKREQYYLDTLKPEFNIRTIAEANYNLKLSDSAKELLHKFWIGVKKKPRTEEHRRNLGDSLRGKNKGKSKPKGFSENLSIQRQGKLNPAYGTISSRRKPIVQTDTGKIFPAISLATKEIGVRFELLYNAIKYKKECNGHYYEYYIKPQ